MPKLIASKLSSILLAVLTLGLSAACTRSHLESQAFLANIYGTYISESSNSSSLQQPDQVYSKALSALIKNDAASAPQGEVGKLNFDPLCSCQDPSGIKDIKIAESSTTSNGSINQVTLFTESDQKVITLTLINESGALKVDDVSSTDIASLKSYLSTAK